MKPATCLQLLSVAVIAATIAIGTVRAAPETNGRCFFSHEFENWKAADAKTLYVRVGLHRYFRLDMAGECRAAMWPNAFLITKFHGSNVVCSAIDWDLQVGHGSDAGLAVPCIVKDMTELTPDEAQALPKKFKP